MTSVGRALWRLALRLLVGGAVVLLLWFLGPEIWRLFSPFLIAIPVAAMLQRPIRVTQKRLRLKRGVAVALWVALVCILICGAAYWLISTVVGQIVQLSTNSQSIITDIINVLRNVSNQLFDSLDYMPASVEEWLRGALNEAFSELSTTASRLISAVFNFAINFASSIPYALIYLNFLLLGIFFITSNYDTLRESLLGHMGDSLRSRSEVISGSAGHGLAGYVKVQLLYGILVFVISVPCLSLFGLPYAFLIALIAAILEFLPIFGNGTLYIPWAVICYVIGLPTLGTEMLILHLTLYIFRRFTEPKLMSNQMGLSTLLSLVAMFVGMQVGGVLGLILAPVVVVVFLGASQAGIFQSTWEDLHRVLEHIRGRLSEPQPEPEATTEQETADE